MAEFVEGEWKDFVFKMITKEDHPKVLENIRQVFCKDEPVLHLAGCSDSEDMLEDFTAFAASVLERNETDKLSFVALDKKTGEIAGLRVTYKASLDDSKEDDSSKPKSALLDAIHNNIMGMGVEVNLFEAYGVDHYAELIFTSVNPEYRGQGLVTEIYRRSFAMLRAKGYPICKSNFTSPATQKLAFRFGFKEHARRKFLEFKYSNGTNIFDNAAPEQEAIVMALQL